MRKTEIKFTIELDEKNVPEKIYWDASDKPDHTLEETKSISVAVWDQKQKNTLRIDLWSKDMPVDEMERFSIECIGGLAQTVLQSTGDEYMANEMNALCDKLVAHIRNKRKG